MKDIVTFFYIDALNSSFVTPDIMPFLSSLTTKGSHVRLMNVIGYSFAIQSCMLSGKYPEETSHWMPYVYSPESSPILFKSLSKIGTIFPLDRLPLLRQLTINQTRELLLKNGVHVNNIPLSVIDHIAIYPYYYMCELPFFYEFRDVLEKKHQVSMAYLGPPTIKRHVYISLLNHIKASKSENKLIITYDDALDGLGHQFGPCSPKCLNYARALDKVLRVIYHKLKDTFGKNLTFIVFSDHGQCEQFHRVDLLSEFNRKGLKLGDDYLCFVDATLALFWSESGVIEEKILTTLSRNKLGRIIDEDQKRKYHIRFSNKGFGEIIFVLKPGVTFFPNFYSSLRPMKGLHGYLPEDDVQESFLISNKLLQSSPIHVKDIRELLKSFFLQ
jgi:predicted AlkP superfamily pyrophosphatase or phosphodiesterase